MNTYLIKSGNDDDGIEFTCDAYQYTYPGDEPTLSVGNIEILSVTLFGVAIKASQLHNDQLLAYVDVVKEFVHDDDDLRERLFANAKYTQK